MKKMLLSVWLLAWMTAYSGTCLGQDTKGKPKPRTTELQSSAPNSEPRDDFNKGKNETAVEDDNRKESTGESNGGAAGGGATAPPLEGGKRYLVPESK